MSQVAVAEKMSHDVAPRDYLAQRALPEPNSGCWLWTGFVDKAGYGVARYAGGTSKAHRFAWQAFRGKIPERLCVCHRCDVRCCVNPDHLFLGSQSDNIADMVAKGRQRGVSRHGLAHPMRKLAEIDVLEIRLLYSLGEATQQQLAAAYGLARPTVSDIVNFRSWRV